MYKSKCVAEYLRFSRASHNFTIVPYTLYIIAPYPSPLCCGLHEGAGIGFVTDYGGQFDVMVEPEG
jgi:hypothetical protein